MLGGLRFLNQSCDTPADQPVPLGEAIQIDALQKLGILGSAGQCRAASVDGCATSAVHGMPAGAPGACRASPHSGKAQGHAVRFSSCVSSPIPGRLDADGQRGWTKGSHRPAQPLHPCACHGGHYAEEHGAYTGAQQGAGPCPACHRLSPLTCGCHAFPAARPAGYCVALPSRPAGPSRRSHTQDRLKCHVRGGPGHRARSLPRYVIVRGH